MLPIVAISRDLPGTVHIPHASIRMGPKGSLTRAELLEHVKGAAVIISWVSEKIDVELLDAAGPQLKGVCNFAVGTDNIDLKACAARNITVTNTPNAVTEGTADLAWLLIMAVARRLIEADRYARSPEYPARGTLGPTEFVGQELTGKTLLIVGAGRIGHAVAKRSLAWGCRVLYVARSRHWDFELAPMAARWVELDEGMVQADIVSIHCPLTPETRGMINARTLALLRPSAILVNTARGPVVDEAALAAALREGTLYGAGLDV